MLSDMDHFCILFEFDMTEILVPKFFSEFSDQFWNLELMFDLHSSSFDVVDFTN